MFCNKSHTVTLTSVTLAEIIENYDDYDYDSNNEKDARVSRSADEWSDAHTRNRRDLANDLNSEDVTYTVCVRLVELDSRHIFLSIYKTVSFAGNGHKS